MVIEHFIEKNREGQYYTVPFSVPENVIKITIKYDYYRPTKGVLSDIKPTNCIDIGLSDEKGNFLGWSGSDHPEISVGEFTSTDGYLTQKINPGEWSILVGAYHVEDEGVNVTYNIDFEYAGEKLLFGDLHIHTRSSDGVYDASQIANLARKNGLDFIALANHNNYAENLHLPAVNGITFIPAVEWTHYNGHMNFFGVANPFENSFVANNHDEMKALIDHAKSLGAVISVNHPKCVFCPYIWGDDEIFDMTEIWNGPMRPTNMRGIEYWTGLLKAGRKVPCVGGSDYHRPVALCNVGIPSNGVYAASQSAEDILDAIKNGHGFVTESPKGPVIDLTYGSCRMGDTAVYDSSTPLEVTVKWGKSCRVILVTDLGEKEIAKGKIRLPKVKFAYVKILGSHGKTIHAVSNPVYFE